MQIAAQVLGLFGVALLAFPAIYVAQYAALAAKLNEAKKNRGSGWDKAVKTAQTNLQTKRDGWNRWMTAALLGGTGAAALSYLVGLVDAILC